MKTFVAILLTLIAMIVLVVFLGDDSVPVIFLIVIGTSVWVLIDARKIGVKAGPVSVFSKGPGGWFFACLLFWIIAFPYYVSVRDQLGQVRKKCPQCLGIVPDGARKCMHCGGDLAVQPVSAPATVAPATVAPKPVPEPRAPEPPAADSQIPCPLCGQRLRVSTLKQGENWCTFCFQKFVIE